MVGLKEDQDHYWPKREKPNQLWTRILNVILFSLLLVKSPHAIQPSGDKISFKRFLLFSNRTTIRTYKIRVPRIEYHLKNRMFCEHFQSRKILSFHDIGLTLHIHQVNPFFESLDPPGHETPGRQSKRPFLLQKPCFNLNIHYYHRESVDISSIASSLFFFSGQ